jgi:hypothetical protein
MKTIIQSVVDPIRWMQIRQIKRLSHDAIKEALDKLDMNIHGAQRVIEHGDEFAEVIRTAAITSLLNLSETDKFKNEEVASNYGYLSGYKPKGITEQTNRLRELFPEIGYADEKLAEQDLPPNAEGWFAIPKWEKFAPTYSKAVQKVLDAVKNARNGKFHNCHDGQINGERLRQSAKTAAVFQKLGDEQKDHDILVVAAQFGIRHRGRSVRRAREVFSVNEFGLGAYAIGIMILTHAERLQHLDDLWIDCAGDEFDDPDAGVRFGHAPRFSFVVGEVRFVTRWFGDASENYGSASVFVP